VARLIAILIAPQLIWSRKRTALAEVDFKGSKTLETTAEEAQRTMTDDTLDSPTDIKQVLSPDRYGGGQLRVLPGTQSRPAEPHRRPAP